MPGDGSDFGGALQRKAANLSGVRKAAVLLMAVGEDLAKEILRTLPEADVERLTEEFADLRGITPEISVAVLGEFWELLATQGFIVHGGLDYASRLLAETFGKQRADDLMLQLRRAQEAEQGNLAKLQRTDPQQLGKLLDAEQPEMALSIRNLMFTFEDLVTVPPATIREIVSGVDKKQLAMALRGANEELRAAIFKSMSARAVEMLKEDMEVLGPVRSREVAQAQQEILNLARRLEAEGKVILKLETGDEMLA